MATSDLVEGLLPENQVNLTFFRFLALAVLPFSCYLTRVSLGILEVKARPIARSFGLAYQNAQKIALIS